jgi:hypothetical protein
MRSSCLGLECVLTWADAHATALVALVALAFTFWQIRVAREHNRLSVRPRVVIWLDTALGADGLQTTTVIAKNLGLGPAYVTKIEYLFDGSPVAIHDTAAVFDAMHAAFGDRWIKTWPLLDLRGVMPIPKDGELPLVKIQTRADADADDLERLRERFRTCIDYLSPYDERLRVEGSAGGPGAPHARVERSE